jgi:hypothetical protein
MSGLLASLDDRDESAPGGCATAASRTTPLSTLIDRHRAGRTCSELAQACGGVISAAQWEELEELPLWGLQPADPSVIEALARALGLTTDTVMHYAMASRVPAAL